jgi:putative transposase
VSLPRQVLPGTTYLITRRTAQRQFLLKPTVKSKQVVLYCFHRAARAHGVQIHALQVLDNHYHAVVTDPNAELPSFMAWVDREIAKCLNELYDRAENLWADDHYSAVVLHDAEAVLGKLVYVYCNVVKALLVRDFRDWHGVRSTPHDWLGLAGTVLRPDFHFNQRDARFAEVIVEYTVPPALRDRDARSLVDDLQRMIDEQQTQIRSDASRAGKAFLGSGRLEKLSPFDFPKSRHIKGRLSPAFAAGTVEGQRRARAMLIHFRTAYREALCKWRSSIACVFPAGCYWLARFANVAVAPLDTACPALDSG